MARHIVTFHALLGRVLSPADVLERVVQDTAPGFVGVYRWEEAVGHQGHGGVLLGEVQPLEVKEPLSTAMPMIGGMELYATQN